MKNYDLLNHINNSFKKHTGCYLPTPTPQANRLEWLDQSAPYSLLAHNTDQDPKFIYANSNALDSFGYSYNEIMNLHSKFSASEIDRPQRLILLESVKKNGIAMNYTGPRVKKDGRFFTIYNGIVWVVEDDLGSEIAQAALFWRDSAVPDWFNIAVKHT